MDQILEECWGCIGITDDITVHGCTKVEHDAHLQNLMHVAHKYGLVSNPQKTHVKVPAVNFFGCLYNADGVHPDLDKVNAIYALPAPTNVTKLQEFLGMVMYPGSLSLACPPWLSFCMSCSRKTQLHLEPTYEAAFQHVKDAVVSDTTLRYFDPSLPMTIQVDASQVGLGVALLQNQKSMAFASKVLSNAKCHYANIEREMLAVAFRAERFRTLCLWQILTIKSDHKPL